MLNSAGHIFRHLYARLQHRQDVERENGLRGVEHNLDRLAQEVLFRVDPPPVGGSAMALLDLIDRLDARAEGKVISSYNLAGKGQLNPQRNGKRDAREDAIMAMTEVDAQIMRRLSRWRSLHRFLEQEGLGCLLDEGKGAGARDGAQAGCFACQHPLIEEMERRLAEGESVRDVADWAAAHGCRIGKSSLYEHVGHLRGTTKEGDGWSDANSTQDGQ